MPPRTTRLRPLNTIVEGGHCLGCGLCSSMADPDAITMTMGSDGFLVPRQLRDDVDVSFLRDVYPSITVRRTGPLRGPQKKRSANLTISNQNTGTKTPT